MRVVFASRVRRASRPVLPSQSIAGATRSRSSVWGFEVRGRSSERRARRTGRPGRRAPRRTEQDPRLKVVAAAPNDQQLRPLVSSEVHEHGRRIASQGESLQPQAIVVRAQTPASGPQEFIRLPARSSSGSATSPGNAHRVRLRQRESRRRREPSQPALGRVLPKPTRRTRRPLGPLVARGPVSAGGAGNGSSMVGMHPSWAPVRVQTMGTALHSHAARAASDRAFARR